MLYLTVEKNTQLVFSLPGFDADGDKASGVLAWRVLALSVVPLRARGRARRSLDVSCGYRVRHPARGPTC
jgi:hypothetical protein